MPTRQEELNNLKTVYSALTDIQKAEESIQKRKRNIEEQQNRSVKYYPVDRTDHHKEETLTNISNHELNAHYSIAIVLILLAILCFAYNLYTLFWEPDMQEGHSVGYAVGRIAGVIIIFGTNYIISLLPLIATNRYGSLISAGYHLAWAGFWSWLESESPYIQLHLNFAAYFGAIGVIRLLCFFLYFPFKKAKNKRILAKAEEEDKKAYETYLEQTAVAQAAFEKKKEALRAEVAANIAHEKEEIQKLKAIINEKNNIIAQTACIAKQDANLHTVSTLISYFERRKADSIKEAINLFDLEERRNDHYTAQMIAQMCANEERKAVLERMEHEQSQYNDALLSSARRMEEEQKKHNEELRQELDSMKKNN